MLSRSTHLMYAQNEQNVEISEAPESNRRVSAERTIFEGDPAPGGVQRFASIARTDFDGLGSYRTATTGGNFSSGNTRTETTDLNLAGKPGISASVSRLRDTHRQQTEGTTTQRREPVLDPVTGALLCERRLAGASRGSTDLLAVYSRNDFGQVTTEAQYGGDFQPLSIADVCTTLPGGCELHQDSRVLEWSPKRN